MENAPDYTKKSRFKLDVLIFAMFLTEQEAALNKL